MFADLLPCPFNLFHRPYSWFDLFTQMEGPPQNLAEWQAANRRYGALGRAGARGGPQTAGMWEVRGTSGSLPTPVLSSARACLLRKGVRTKDGVTGVALQCVVDDCYSGFLRSFGGFVLGVPSNAARASIRPPK
jgi:hypothetical protein